MNEREERGREIGAKLAQALRSHANKLRDEHDVDVRFVVLGAIDALSDWLDTLDRIVAPDAPEIVDRAKTEGADEQN